MVALAEPTVALAIVALAAERALHESRPDRRRPRWRIPRMRRSAPDTCWPSPRCFIVTLAETGRLPVDNPATHLELTMIHEAMVLEYSGRYLALVEWAAAIKLFVFSRPAGRTSSCRGGWPHADPGRAPDALGSLSLA